MGLPSIDRYLTGFGLYLRQTELDSGSGGDTTPAETTIARFIKSIEPVQLLAMNRYYWQIENGLHYHKDMVFGEDRSTIRSQHGPANMATLRKFAIGLLLNDGIGNVKRYVENLRRDPLQLSQLVA